MICHKRDLIACFFSDVNVTFVFFNICVLNVDVYFDWKTNIIDSLVSVQAENNKNNWKLLFSSTPS